MSQYQVSLEISGPTAMWTRSDTGDVPISYPAPTFAAIKGIFECLLWSQWAEVIPTKVEICKPIVYHNYVTNYGGPLRESKNGSYQLLAMVLVNVCYRLYATVASDLTGYDKHGRPGMQSKGTTNGAHAYQAMFERRLKNGQLYYTPCLGWKEFVPDYVGFFRPETKVCNDINIAIPSMLRTCFSQGKNSKYDPYFKPTTITNGVLCYAE